MAISDFEKQRQENIQRNKELLRLLNLDSISNSIKKELPSSPSPSALKRQKRTKISPASSTRESAEPSRRSRRLAGVKVENSEEYAKLQREADAQEEKKKQVEKLKQTRLYGNFHLIDLVTGPKGELKNGDKVFKKEDEDGIEGSNVSVDDVKADSAVLDILKDLGAKFSAGDFYDLIRDKVNATDDDYDLGKKRKEFDNLKLYERFDPLDIKITHQRISAVTFHPATEDRVIAVGDTVGDLGIWAVDSKSESKEDDDEDEPTISIVKPHGKLISRLLTPTAEPTKIFSASYDGSVRSLDLNKLKSSELAYLNDPFVDGDHPLGVSDINLCADNQNILYMTTLSGNFYQHDIRQPFKATAEKSLLRLHDKKIGSFSVSPNKSYQIATASLDRTLKIWDLRNVSAANSSWSDYELENQQSPHCYGSYSSKLSVSCVDWNLDDRLVCNGYDDQIAVFDLTEGEKPVAEWADTYQPNVPAKKKSKRNAPEENEIPVNLTPLTKIRHNCQTGRWVSILKSKWQQTPADGVQKFCIANMNRGIDVYDQKGQILAHLTEEMVGAVPAVVAMHPLQNWCVGGSASGKLYFFE